jgi:hypothetical protein
MKPRARDARFNSLEGRFMPGMHVGGSLHDTFHPTEVRPPEVRPPSGFTRPGSSDIAASPQSAASHSVLRLRGGGNMQGSRGKGDDRENLLPDGAGSSSHGMSRGTESTSATQRAANAIKRYELQAMLDRATRDRDVARAGRENALAGLEEAKEEITRLVAGKDRSGSDPARRREIQQRLDTAHLNFQRKTREVSDCNEKLREIDSACRGLQRKLDRLRWT